MSRITLNSKCRLCRAIGKKMYLKGVRCPSAKCPLDKKGAVPPGMHGIKIRRKTTDYGLQLRAKQEVKRLYGINETQFKNLYLKAKRIKGLTGDNFLSLLESRLDNVVYQAGLALSRSHARQLISHRHFTVNGKKVSVSSYLLRPGETIILDQKAFDQYADSLRCQSKDFQVGGWLELDKSHRSVVFKSCPTRADNIGQGLDINLIIEYYSR